MFGKMYRVVVRRHGRSTTLAQTEWMSFTEATRLVAEWSVYESEHEHFELESGVSVLGRIIPATQERIPV